MKISSLHITIAILLCSQVLSLAIEGLSIKSVETNIVLSWPSTEGDIYIIQYKETVDTNTTWQILTNTLPAATGTNKTSFVHFGVVPPPFSGTNGSPGAIPQPPSVNSSTRTSTGSVDSPTFPLPPVPWDPNTWTTDNNMNEATQSSLEITQLGETSTTDSSSPTCGFYQIVRQGVHILNFTSLTSVNTNVSNVLSLQIEAGNLDGIIDSITILADGQKCSGSQMLTPPFEFPLTVDIDTAYLLNGEHTFQVLVEWKRDSDPYVLDLYSDSFTLSVSNIVMYQDWEELVGNNVSAFFLSTVDPSANVQLDIYDSNGNYIKTLYSQATNNTVEIYWDLVDCNGNKRNNPEIDPIFYSVTTVFSSENSSFLANANADVQQPATASTGGKSSPNPPKKQLIDNFPDQGGWAVAYQDIFRYSYDEDNYLANTLYDIGAIASMHGNVYAAPPSTGQSQTWPIRYIYTNHPDTNINLWTEINDAQKLLNYLKNPLVRNLIYVGHGTRTSIAELSQRDLQAIRHRFRFVYLYSCLCANGSLDSAFHIKGRGMYPLSHYQKTGIRPGLFCGNNDEVYWGRDDGSHNLDGYIFWQFPAWIDNFLFFWHYYGYGADGAFYYTSQSVPDIPGVPSNHQPGGSLILNGYTSLTIDGYNFKNDW